MLTNTGGILKIKWAWPNFRACCGKMLSHLCCLSVMITESIMNSNLLGCAKNKKNRIKWFSTSMQMFPEVVKLLH